MGKQVKAENAQGAIGFAEKLLELLDEGRYTSTYKFAVLLAIMDLCLEGTQTSGAPPTSLTTRQLAGKVVELYWPHTVPFAGQRPPTILRQNAGGQAEIVTSIRRFREQHAPDPSLTHWASRLSAPDLYNRLVLHVEWKLVQMPLPRLQRVGKTERRFIYEINWDERVARTAVAAYQRGVLQSFDNRILLHTDVGDHFILLSGLLRPLIHRQWAAMIAALNHLEESQLEIFLFGAVRTATAKVRAGLWEMQGKRCFYCDAAIGDPTRGEVDHFIPWSRYPDDGLDNFVVADPRCNGSKSNSLAAASHLMRWRERLTPGSVHTQLAGLATSARWIRTEQKSLHVARAIYPRLPGDARLWLRGGEFVPPNYQQIIEALNIERVLSG